MVDIVQHLPTPVTGNIPAKSLREYYPKHHHMTLEELEYSSIGTLIQEPLSYLGIYFQNKALANVVDPFRRGFFSQALSLAALIARN